MDPHFDLNLKDNIMAQKRHPYHPTPPPAPQKRMKLKGDQAKVTNVASTDQKKSGLCQHPRLRFFQTEKSCCFGFMSANICFSLLTCLFLVEHLWCFLMKRKKPFFRDILFACNPLRTEASIRRSFWQKLDCVYSQLHS